MARNNAIEDDAARAIEPLRIRKACGSHVIRVAPYSLGCMHCSGSLQVFLLWNMSVPLRSTCRSACFNAPAIVRVIMHLP
eukprot:1159807-Pelagomonas_calceolata.AAC.7